MLNFLKNLGPVELIIIGLIVVILFGSKIAKSLGRTSGEAIKEFKKIKDEVTK